MTLLEELLSGPGTTLLEPAPAPPRATELAPEQGDHLRRPQGAPSHGGGQTLDEVLSSAWEGLSAARPVPCPLCTGRMTPRYGAGPGPVAAVCGDCGTELS
jgi:hypothetical protein